MKKSILLTLVLLGLVTFVNSAAVNVPTPACEEELLLPGGGCNTITQQCSIKVTCTSGSVTVKAYLNGVWVNTQTITSGNSYTFYRSNSSQTLKLEVCWSSGYYTWTCV